MSSTRTTMEQQQNELFALIGQLTYRLRLVEAENEKLKDENRTTTEKLQDMARDYTRIVVENHHLEEKLQERNAMDAVRPVAQLVSEPPFEADESTIFPLLNEAQIESFYAREQCDMCQSWCKDCTEYENFPRGTEWRHCDYHFGNRQ